MTNLWIKTDELQISAVQGQERSKLSVLRRVWFRLEGGIKPGARFTPAKAAFPYEVSRPTSATPNLILSLTVDADQLWMDFITLCAFDLGSCEA